MALARPREWKTITSYAAFLRPQAAKVKKLSSSFWSYVSASVVEPTKSAGLPDLELNYYNSNTNFEF
jgi:hypothetical protein